MKGTGQDGGDPPESRVEGEPGDADEAAFDAYLDALLAGDAEDPDAFLARRPPAGPALRERLLALRGLARPPGTEAPSRVPPRAADPGLPHERLGEFRLLRRLGSGGMGTVFEAEQESLGRAVALKVIRPDLGGSMEAVERFRREARALARLRHPGILGIIGAGEQDGVHYLAADLVPGRGLDEILEEARVEGRPPPAARVIRWGALLARALEHAHAAGVVHRDVKPSNVRITPDDRALLLDFGIVRDLAGGPTLTAAFVGSPLYAAPEQLRGGPVDGRADVYGLAATLYHVLTGRAPFEGETVDGVIQRVLNEDPAPPRVRNPAVPPDLDAVLLKGLEKEAGRRYATAREMAEDLEAILELRPVRARPPGALRRLRGWGRRRPAVAAAALTGTAAAVLLGAALFSRARAGERRVRGEAAAEVDRAREGLHAYRRDRERTAAVEKELSYLRTQMESAFTDPGADRLLDQREDAMEDLRRRREALYHESLERLRRAERLDPAVEGPEEVRAALYMERWREARDRRDAAEADFYRSLVESGPGAASLRAAVRPEGLLTLSSDPPGAEVHLFRYEEQSRVVPEGEPRLVPVPVSGEPPVHPGTWCLRVVDGAGALRRGELILSLAGHPVRDTVLVSDGSGRARRFDRLLTVDGAAVRDPFEAAAADAPAADDGEPRERLYAFERDGERFEVRGTSLADLGIAVTDPAGAARLGGATARVLGAGTIRETTLPAAIRARATAAPLLPSPATRSGATPVGNLRLEEGEYVALLRKEGFEDQRVHFLVAPDRPAEIRIGLLPEGTTPPGWVRVPAPREEEGPPFWIQDREVTAGEYLEFLRDPAVRARMEAAPDPVLFPRDPHTAAGGGYWGRGPGGEFVLKDGWEPRWPVLGISLEDARAYAAWRTERERASGGRRVFSLPTFGQWLAAAGDGKRTFVFGDRFRPKWVKSCFARPRATPEPVLAFPRDESAMGVFDLSGSAMEWSASWYDRPRGLHRLMGGSWARAEAGFFEIWGGLGLGPGAAGGENGIRLVMTEEER